MKRKVPQFSRERTATTLFGLDQTAALHGEYCIVVSIVSFVKEKTFSDFILTVLALSRALPTDLASPVYTLAYANSVSLSQL